MATCEFEWNNQEYPDDPCICDLDSPHVGYHVCECGNELWVEDYTSDFERYCKLAEQEAYNQPSVGLVFAILALAKATN